MLLPAYCLLPPIWYHLWSHCIHPIIQVINEDLLCLFQNCEGRNLSPATTRLQAMNYVLSLLNQLIFISLNIHLSKHSLFSLSIGIPCQRIFESPAKVNATQINFFLYSQSQSLPHGSLASSALLWWSYAGWFCCSKMFAEFEYYQLFCLWRNKTTSDSFLVIPGKVFADRPIIYRKKE